MKLKTKTQNIFCCLNENLTTFLCTLTLCHPDKKTKCIQKSNVIFKKKWVLVFSFMYLVLVDAMDKSNNMFKSIFPLLQTSCLHGSKHSFCLVCLGVDSIYCTYNIKMDADHRCNSNFYWIIARSCCNNYSSFFMPGRMLW